MRKITEYTNSQMSTLIDEHIHNLKYRNILRLRYIDGFTYERIAEIVDMSTQQVKSIVYRSQEKLMRYL